MKNEHYNYMKIIIILFRYFRTVYIRIRTIWVKKCIIHGLLFLREKSSKRWGNYSSVTVLYIYYQDFHFEKVQWWNDSVVLRPIFYYNQELTTTVFNSCKYSDVSSKDDVTRFLSLLCNLEFLTSFLSEYSLQ